MSFCYRRQPSSMATGFGREQAALRFRLNAALVNAAGFTPVDEFLHAHAWYTFGLIKLQVLAQKVSLALNLAFAARYVSD